MNNLGPKVYPYRSSWVTLALAILFFGAAAVGLAFLANGNTKGLRVLRLFTMSPAAATGFYCVLSILSALMTVTAIFGIWKRLSRPQEITLDDDGLVVPRSFLSRDGVRVPFAQIQAVEVTEVTGDRFMHLRVHDGTRRSITQSLLPSKAAFEEILGAVRDRAALVTPPQGP